MHWHAFSKNKSTWIVGLSALGILAYLLTAQALPLAQTMRDEILIAVVILGGLPMLYDILKEFAHGEFGADALAMISIVTSLVLKQYLAGSIIVFMLSGGSLLESYAVHSASSVLNALLKRMPKMAHRKAGVQISDIAIETIQIQDTLVIFPHEIAPVDGTVLEGHGFMDESFLTGEPFLMSKAPGSDVYSGAINGEVALVIRATKAPKNSRYAKIMEVMKAAEEKRLRREPVCGIPHFLVGDGPGRPHANEKIAPHFTHHVSQQRQQQADAAFHRAAHLEHPGKARGNHQRMDICQHRQRYDRRPYNHHHHSQSLLSGPCSLA